jgi:hypothetical protein
MQRLNRRDDDRGAVAVWMALLLIPLLMVGALAIDVGAMHADQQRLQTGADAAALAIAQDCADGSCGDTETTADELATANDPLGSAAEGTVVTLDEGAGYVEVETESERNHLFAPIMGIDESLLTARGAAAWGPPSGGPAMIPFTFSWCELHVQAGFPLLRDPVTNAVIGLDIPPEGRTITMHSTKTSGSGCTGPSGNAIPGGFGWLNPTANCGPVETTLGIAPGDNGGSPPNGCTAAHFDAMIGKTSMLPIFDQATGEGSHARYRLIGYAAFKLESYYFTGGFRPSPAICSGNERCIRGTFLEFVDLDSEFTTAPGTPSFGADIVSLRLPEGAS